MTHKQQIEQKKPPPRGYNLNKTISNASLCVGLAPAPEHGAPAVFSAQRQALQYTDGDQRNGSKPAGSLKSRHQADEESPSAHYGERNQKGILASDEVTDPSEK